MTTAIPRALVAEALGIAQEALPPGDLPLDRLAARYLAYLRAGKGDELAPADHPDAWTADVYFELTDAHPALGLAATEAAIAAAETPQDVALIAAGPLEDLIAHHGAALIDEIEALAPRAPRFAYALTGVWPQGADGTLLWARIEAARRDVQGLDAGAPLPPACGF